MLLSSVAERVYWFARYVERVENTARILLVNNNLLLDMPRNSTLGWEPIISITGIPDTFYENHKEATERNVMSLHHHGSKESELHAQFYHPCARELTYLESDLPESSLGDAERSLQLRQGKQISGYDPAQPL